MGVINPNTRDMEDLGPSDPGTYPAVIKSCDAKASSKGNQMITPKFEIRAQADGKAATKTRTAYLVIEGKGTAGFDSLLRACHMDELADKYRNGDRVPFDTDRLVGQEVLVVVDNEWYTPTDDLGNKTGEPEKRDRLKNFLKK
jgi:hypothetical protein